MSLLRWLGVECVSTLRLSGILKQVGAECETEITRMVKSSNGYHLFSGDRIRVIVTPETKGIGIAGLRGIVSSLDGYDDKLKISVDDVGILIIQPYHLVLVRAEENQLNAK